MSEHTLDGLIAKVKSEAIDTAEKEANQIIDNAKAKAKEIVTNAEAKKAELIKDATSESKAILDKGKVALYQASRDVQVTVKNDLLQLFKSVLETEVETAFSSDLYNTIITKVIDTLGTNIVITLPEQTEDLLIKTIQNKIAASKNTINIIKKEQLLSGLSVTKTDEGWSYDITAKEISEVLSQHLSQRWLELLNKK
jgi:vacuolar-type H+-ATPase subunit E/Vma4